MIRFFVYVWYRVPQTGLKTIAIGNHLGPYSTFPKFNVEPHPGTSKKDGRLYVGPLLVFALVTEGL